MKKLLLFLMIFLSFSLVNAQVHGINFNDKIILRINGHDRSLPGDILNEFDKSWKEYKGNFERDMIGMGNNDAKMKILPSHAPCFLFRNSICTVAKKG